MTTAEEVIVEEIPSEQEDHETGVPIYKIVSYPSDPTLDLLHQKWERQEIIIPGFQRGWVWSHVQASRLIESFLLGLPVPPIFVYKEPASQKQLVIDGQQRLKTIWAFFEGTLPRGGDFYLKGVRPEWEGKQYVHLEESDRIRLRDSVLRSVTVEQLDPKDDTSIYHIFERLNTSGTVLTPQEVRNCVYHGPFNNLTFQLNNDPTWRTVFGVDTPDPRMRDAELIVRFFALWEDTDLYTKPMKQFLNTFMARHQSDADTDSYRLTFLETVKRVADSLGPKPFHIKRGINAAVFDSVMVAFAGSFSRPSDILTRFWALLANPSYSDATSSATTDVDTVKRRISLAREVLFG